MSLARSYKRRNAASTLALPAPPSRAPRWANSGQAALPPATGHQVASSSSSSSAPPRPFKRLMPDEMAERHKLGLCYSCDEQYVKGHKCSCLFYLEVSDYIVEELEEPGEDHADEPPPASFDPDTPMIALAAIAGIHTEDTMQLYITMGERAVRRTA